MTPQNVIGWLAFALVGITLGLFGSGGSILTVPLLVYFFGSSPSIATGESLFIVGVTSLAGAIKKSLDGQLELRPAVAFAIPATAIAFLMRLWVMPKVPSLIFGVVDKQKLLIFCLIGLMFAVGLMAPRKAESSDVQEDKPAKLALLGAGVGLIAGALGAGGGFIIVPALVSFARMPMSKAIGTSIAIIAVQSLAGFTGEAISNPKIDWPLILVCTSIALVGLVFGLIVGKKLPTKELQKYFRIFILIVATVLLGMQFVNR